MIATIATPTAMAASFQETPEAGRRRSSRASRPSARTVPAAHDRGSALADRRGENPTGFGLIDSDARRGAT
jgi:hypothetical protein